MSDYTKDFPKLSTYNFDTILCQLQQVCGADTSGLISAQFKSRPTTAKDIALLLHITYELFQAQKSLQTQFAELYNFVKDFFSNLDLQEEVNNWLEQAYNSGKILELISELTLGYLTPEMYGAKGDGVTDDSNAMQLCINNAYEKHMNVFLQKSYLITKQIDLPSTSLSSSENGTFQIYGVNNKVSGIIFKVTTKSSVFNSDETQKIHFHDMYLKNISDENILTTGINITGFSMGINLSRVFIYNFSYGVYLVVITSVLNQVFCNSCEIGFYVNSTSTNLISCYASQCFKKYLDKGGIGYELYGDYSSLISCASDSNEVSAYYVGGAWDINNCGCENNPKCFIINNTKLYNCIINNVNLADPYETVFDYMGGFLIVMNLNYDFSKALLFNMNNNDYNKISMINPRYEMSNISLLKQSYPPFNGYVLAPGVMPKIYTGRYFLHKIMKYGKTFTIDLNANENTYLTFEINSKVAQNYSNNKPDFHYIRFSVTGYNDNFTLGGADKSDDNISVVRNSNTLTITINSSNNFYNEIECYSIGGDVDITVN